MKWAWASHVPLLKAIMAVMQPTFVYEAGIGNYSTPILSGSDAYYVGVENDMKWIREMESKFPDINIQHQRIHRKINRNTRYWNIPDQSHIFVDFRRIYDAFSVKGYSLLFVDGYAGTRKIALEALLSYFDCVVFHDSDQSHLYGYDQFDFNEFTRYDLHSKLNSTTMLIKDETKMESLIKEVNFQIHRFNKDWKINSEMLFRKK